MAFIFAQNRITIDDNTLESHLIDERIPLPNLFIARFELDFELILNN